MPSSREPAGPLTSLFRSLHRELDHLFLRAREALFERRLDEARELFEAWEDALRAHAALEEALILPRADRAVEAGRAAAVAIYSGEHVRMLELAAAARGAVAALAARAEPPSTRELIALFDEQGTIRRLADHHQAREENILLPALERGLPAAELEALVERCRLRQ